MNINPHFRFNSGLSYLQYDRLKLRRTYNSLVDQQKNEVLYIRYLQQQELLNSENPYQFQYELIRHRMHLNVLTQQLNLLDQYFENLSKG